MPVRDATATTSTLASFPAFRPAVVPGDRLLLVQVSDRTGDLGTPSGGWAPLAQELSGGVLETRVWVKTAGTSEPSSYTVSQGGFGDCVVIIASIPGAAAGTPRVATGESIGFGALCPSVSLPAGTGTEIRIGTGGSGSAPNGADWSAPDLTPAAEAQSRVFTSAVLAWRPITEPGPVGELFLGVDDELLRLHGITIVIPDQAGGGGGDTPPVPPPTVPALPSGAQVVHYTYEFADLLTDALVCKDLDLRDVSYSRRISEAGEFSASVDIVNPVTAAKVARIVPRHPEDLSTGPGRTVCHVYRNGVVWGSYVIWAASVSRQGKGAITVSLSGSSLESYLSHVKIRDDITYEGWDQIDIARDLITRMQSTPRYNLGLQFQDGVSGVTRDRTYLASEASTYGERLAELGNVENGFEWAIQTIDNGDGTRTRVLTWGYPKLGNAATSHKFTEPGNVLSWQEDIDSLRGGTAFQARGESINEDASETSEPLVSQVVVAGPHIDAGWPGLDVTADYNSVSEIDTLDAYAQWWASERAGAVRVHQATVRLPANTSFGPGNLGDSVTLMLVNDWWPVVDGAASFAKTWRVVGMDFKPPQKGSGQEECTLTFEELAED